MGRPIRWIPPSESGWTTVEVTSRTIQRKFLLRPEPKLRLRIIGVYARAQERTGVRIHAARFLSTHGHTLLSVQDVKQLRDFMQYTQGNIAREICRLTGWSDKVWARRYKHSILSEEPEVEYRRLRYVLENGVKEGLVGSTLEWPCDLALHTLLAGKTRVRGEWVNRTGLYKARQRGELRSELDFTSSEFLELSPLPSLAHLSPEEYALFLEELVHDIDAEARAQHRVNGTRPLGVQAVMARDPFDEPAPAKRSPAPLFLAASREAFLVLKEAYRLVLERFLRASARFRAGDRSVVFPENCYPPAPEIVLGGLARGPDT